MKFNKIETKEKVPEIYDIFALTEEQISHLTTQVSNSGGKIRIFIHPYLSGRASNMPRTEVDPEIDHQKVYETMVAGFNKIIVSDSKKVPPLFVFEEYNKVAKTKSELKDIAKNDIYFVPTNPGYPAPHIPDSVFDEIFSKKGHRPDGWEYITELFKQIGVKSVLIAGRNFTITEYENGKGFALNSCVGNAFKELKDGFDVELSNLTYPNRKNQIDIKKRYYS